MQNTQNISQYINFHGNEWAVLKLWLEAALERKIGLLINETDPDKSNQIRGAILAFKEILALEKAANQAANQGPR